MALIGSGMFFFFSHDANMDITVIWAAGSVNFPDGHKGHPLREQEMVPDPWWLLKTPGQGLGRCWWQSALGQSCNKSPSKGLKSLGEPVAVFGCW